MQSVRWLYPQSVTLSSWVSLFNLELELAAGVADGMIQYCFKPCFSNLRGLKSCATDTNEQCSKYSLPSVSHLLKPMGSFNR